LQSSRTRFGAPPISCSQTVLIHIKPRDGRHWLYDVRRKSRTDLIHIRDRTKYQPPTSVPKRMVKRGVSAELPLFQNLGRNHCRAVGRGLLRSPFRPCLRTSRPSTSWNGMDGPMANSPCFSGVSSRNIMISTYTGRLDRLVEEENLRKQTPRRRESLHVDNAKVSSNARMPSARSLLTLKHGLRASQSSFHNPAHVVRISRTTHATYDLLCTLSAVVFIIRPVGRTSTPPQCTTSFGRRLA
jgi:hypothetical protein